MTTQDEWEQEKKRKIDEFDSRHLQSMRNLVHQDDPRLSYFERHGEYYTGMECTRGDAFESPLYMYGDGPRGPGRGHMKQKSDNCVQETYWISADYGKTSSQCDNPRGYGHRNLYCKQHAVIHPTK